MAGFGTWAVAGFKPGTVGYDPRTPTVPAMFSKEAVHSKIDRLCNLVKKCSVKPYK
jgi:hypothetical protein